jgi:hypothetical protein
VVTDRTYGANASLEELTEAMSGPAFQRCMRILVLVEAIRFPAGRKDTAGKQYTARCNIHDALTVIALAREDLNA